MSESLAVLPSHLEEFANRNGMTKQEALALLEDPEAVKRLQEITKWRSRVAFHGRGIQRLIDIVDGDDDKAALAALNMLGKLAGEFQAPRPITITFDELMKGKGAGGPLSGITQIREAEAINAEDADSDDDTI